MKPSLFEMIMGGGDQTPDPVSGLTNADRSQIGFGGIANIGALLMAAGEPMWGNERARYLAMLGGVPGSMNDQRAQMVQQKRLAQQLKSEQSASAATQSIRDMAKDPASTAGMSPQMQTLMRAALLSGNPASAVAVQKEAREQMQPVPLGNGMFWDRQSNTAVNPYTNVRLQLGPNGNMVGGTYLNGQPIEEGDDEIDPQTGRREKWLAKQDPVTQARLRRMADADEQIPSPNSRAPDSIALRNNIAHYAPNTKEQDYKTKGDFKKQVEGGGQIFQRVLRPSQTFLNHAASFLDAYEKLGMEDGVLAKNGGNLVRQQLYIRQGGEKGGQVKAAEAALHGIKDEFSKFMAGNGQLTDYARKLQSDISTASTPSEVKAVIGEMTKLMHGQLQPVVDQYRVNMKLPSATPANLLGVEAAKSLEKVENWKPKELTATNAAKPNQSDEQPPVPGARKAPDGNWYVQQDGKYFKVQ